VETATAEAPDVVTLDPPPRDRLRAEIPRLLVDPVWRTRIAQTEPLPRRARLAPPILAEDVIGSLGDAPVPVHVSRSYLAPLGVAVAERIGAPWASLDLDEDDETLAASMGEPAESAAYGRLVRVFGPAFDEVALAAPHEATAVAARSGLSPRVIPNAVRMPDGTRPAPRRSGGASILFVGNLTYRPNADAARALIEEVLPELRRVVDEPITVTIAGDPGADASIRRLGRRAGVRVAEFVPDLGPLYADADAVVAPLAVGGGTRVKVLEAFAHQVPVITSSAGVAGLDARDGVHLLIADSPADTARAVARVLEDGTLARRLREEAARLVRHSYSDEAVTPLVRAFFASAGRAPPATGRRHR
jgi:glycosyltransferase involved in cell wall biosynthesis